MNYKKFRLEILFPLLARLPDGLSYRVANRIGRHDARHHPMREAVTAGLCHFLPELRSDEARREHLVQEHFKMLARDTLDCFKMERFTPAKDRHLFRINSIEAMRDAQAAGRGVLLVISHYGRFFMMGPGLGFEGIKFGMFTTMVDERHPTYDPTDRRYMRRKILNFQRFSQGTWITTGDDMRKVYRCLKSGETILFAFEGNETISRDRCEFPFASGTLSVPGGLVRIAEKTGAKLVYVAAQDRGPGVEITIHPLPDEPKEALAEAVRFLEQDLKNFPWNWWLWPGIGSLWQPPACHSDQTRA